MKNDEGRIYIYKKNEDLMYYYATINILSKKYSKTFSYNEDGLKKANEWILMKKYKFNKKTSLDEFIGFKMCLF